MDAIFCGEQTLSWMKEFTLFYFVYFACSLQKAMDAIVKAE
jgi:hypothetical protein